MLHNIFVWLIYHFPVIGKSSFLHASRTESQEHTNGYYLCVYIECYPFPLHLARTLLGSNLGLKVIHFFMWSLSLYKNRYN